MTWISPIALGIFGLVLIVIAFSVRGDAMKNEEEIKKYKRENEILMDTIKMQGTWIEDTQNRYLKVRGKLVKAVNVLESVRDIDEDADEVLKEIGENW